MRLPTIYWVILSGSATAAVIHVVLGGPEAPLRGVVVLPFVLLLPGTAVIRLLELSEPLLELTLGIALSIAMAMLIAMATLYADAWSPDAVLIVLAEVTIAAVLFELLIALRRYMDSQAS
ncbi:MAG: hypothetical protein H0V68_01565 [Actinobacteria bacterium]|nr:hypothetical protein [Actinomycetota bacterium]